MAVNRRGKRGRRAGGGGIRPGSRNWRVKANARTNNIAKEQDTRPTSNRISKEQWVVQFVTRVIGTSAGSHVKADDVASDVLLELLNANGFGWEADEIEDFCRRKVRAALIAFKFRRETCECDFVLPDGGQSSFLEILSVAKAHQLTVVEATEARVLLDKIPDAQRAALEILCDGGNPIDVSEELGITPWAALALIKEGREYVLRV